LNTVTIEGKTFQLGQKIRFNQKYSTNASRRFANTYRYSREPQDARPMGYLGKAVTESGWVVGVRSVIMRTTLYEPSSGEEQGQRRGDNEQCLLVTQHIRKAPVLVRLADVLDPEASV
jgi:hypothetical protein